MKSDSDRDVVFLLNLWAQRQKRKRVRVHKLLQRRKKYGEYDHGIDSDSISEGQNNSFTTSFAQVLSNILVSRLCLCNCFLCCHIAISMVLLSTRMIISSVLTMLCSSQDYTSPLRTSLGFSWQRLVNISLSYKNKQARQSITLSHLSSEKDNRTH